MKYTPISSQLMYKEQIAYNDRIKDMRVLFNWNHNEVLRLVQQLAADYVPAEDTGSYVVVQNKNQPVWDLHDKDSEIKEIEDPEPYNEDKIIYTRTDPFAYYKPAHFHSQKDYGIYFIFPRIMKIAARLLKDYAPADLSLDELTLLVFEIALWHEACHAWIEDLCSFAERITGVDYYTGATEEYGCFILMEEAVCNTAATGMLSFFYRNRPEETAVKQIYTDFMNNQPAGYKDYEELGWWCTHEEMFLVNIKKLLVSVYKIPEVIAKFVLSSFFEPNEQLFSKDDCREYSDIAHNIRYHPMNDFHDTLPERNYAFAEFMEIYMKRMQYPIGVVKK